MKNIQVEIINEEDIEKANNLFISSCRLTQSCEKIHCLADFNELLNKDYSDDLTRKLNKMQHRSPLSLININIIIVGCSRRFLAQITRHSNVNFISSSLQYSNYGQDANFVIPYNVIGNKYLEALFRAQNNQDLELYNILMINEIDNDEAAYVLPQSLRGALIISANVYQWQHMINQRLCKRNSIETRYIILKCWQILYHINKDLFSPEVCLPNCYKLNKCLEGRLSCNSRYKENITPDEILKEEFSKLV